jgi:phage terminase large subunit-like protein
MVESGVKMNGAEQYIDDVMNNRIVVCKWVRRAVERHLYDLEHGHERGLYFDAKEAKHVIDFFQLLRFCKGREFAGKPVRLSNWQQFFIWVLFGWKKANGYRRFSTAYLQVGRKNGKTTISGGIADYLLLGDGEPGAEVYIAATKKDQARICYDIATRMITTSISLKKRCEIYKKGWTIVPSTMSKMEPLGRDSDSMDGLDLSGGIADELHAHKTPEVWDKLRTATSARTQPLLMGITTAGFDRESICYIEYSYSIDILENFDRKDGFQDDSYFPLIFTIDEGDSWEDESVWVKANPNLGVSKSIDYLKKEVNAAKQSPTKINTFLRLDLNVWTQSKSRWVIREHWDACGTLEIDLALLKGKTAYMGLDLSSTTDISALVLVFPPDEVTKYFVALFRFFCPEATISERSKMDRVPYETWRMRNHIIATPGNTIDYAFIFEQIKLDLSIYAIKELAFDRWGSQMIIHEIEELGLECIMFGQGFASMSGPMKDLEKQIIDHRLAHGNQPVMNWMADNVVAVMDPSGNIKPDKNVSRQRIDGMTALIMAFARAIIHNNSQSVYEKRGLRKL